MGSAKVQDRPEFFLLFLNFKELVKKEIEIYLTHKDTNEVSITILWDALRVVLRGRLRVWC